MRHKNDYTIIAFFETQNTKKWTYVHTLSSIAKLLDAKHPEWKYFNVYDRRTANYKGRIYKDSKVPEHL